MNAVLIEEPVAVTLAAEPDANALALVLGLGQLQRLSDMLYCMLEAEIKATGLLADLINAADSMCYDCLAEEPTMKLAEASALWFQVGKIRTVVRAACYIAAHEPREATPDLHAVLLPHAAGFTSALEAALNAAPADLEPLQSLASTSFAKASTLAQGDRA